MYYLRTQAARDAIKFTVDTSKAKVKEKTEESKEVLKDENKKETPVKNDIHVIDDDDPGVCLSCGA
jgi:hypothetical protein